MSCWAARWPSRSLVAIGSIRDEDVNAFLREARILAGLDHEHIVPVYDVGCTPDGLCFVVSKLIDGESLTSRAVGLHADYGRIARLVAAVADALHHAHQHGLVHRDVKPANLLIDRAGKAYLADFGLALREEDFGRAERLAGTPAYMSPEQVRGEGHRVDGRTDIFSLGIVLYELISGAHPFGDGEPSTIMRRIAFEEPVPPRRVVAEIPRELERICLRALAPRASDRYETARELADELKLYAEGAEAPDRHGVADARTAAADVPRRPAMPDRPRAPRGSSASSPRDCAPSARMTRTSSSTCCTGPGTATACPIRCGSGRPGSRRPIRSRSG